MDTLQNLFFRKNINLKSGGRSGYKIECDALTTNDFMTLAWMVSEKFTFKKVLGVPRGGLIFAQQLQKYENKNSEDLLIVDDVLTSGKTIKEYCLQYTDQYKVIKGVVVFARRNNCPSWVTPVFALNNLFGEV